MQIKGYWCSFQNVVSVFSILVIMLSPNMQLFASIAERPWHSTKICSTWKFCSMLRLGAINRGFWSVTSSVHHNTQVMDKVLIASHTHLWEFYHRRWPGAHFRCINKYNKLPDTPWYKGRCHNAVCQDSGSTHWNARRPIYRSPKQFLAWVQWW